MTPPRDRRHRPGQRRRSSARRRRPAVVQGRDHLPAARQGVLRRRTTTGSAISRGCAASSITCRISGSPRCGCCRSIPRRCATTATTSPTTGTSTPPTARMADFKALRARGARRDLGSSPSWSSITPRTSIRGFSARAAPSPVRRCATITCGATPTRNSPKPGSSSSIPRSRTGPGTRWRRPITGTASTRTSPISISTIRGCFARSRM